MNTIQTSTITSQRFTFLRIVLIGCVWLLAVTSSFAQVPAVPTSVTATTASSTQINLTWVDASTNETGFQIERSTTSGTGFALIFTAAANAVSYSDAGVVANTMYYYRIRATNGSGSSAYSTQTGSSTITPSAPSALTATVGTTTSINLAWVDGSADETGFQIWMSTTAGSGYSLIATNPANQVTRSVTGLSVNVRYYFQVRATNGALTSAYTNEATAITSTPALPTSVTAIATSPTQITLSWVDNATIETGYGVERSTTSGTGFVLVTTAAINATGFVDTGLTTGTTYYYRIRALNGGLPSAYTTQIGTAIVVPAAPTTLAATAASATQVNLTWVDASTNETGFIIERSTTSGSGFVLVTTTAANTTSYSNTGLTANTTYYYRIRSTNGVGSSANTAEVVVATSIPAIPTNPLATLTNSSGQVSITWTDVSNNETAFQVERSTTSGTGFVWIVTTAANATSFLNTGLTPGTTYYYRVRSLNLVGYSNYSSEVSVKIAVPSAPTSFQALPSSSTQINLTWVDPITFETGFSLERSTTSTTAGFTVLANLPPNTTSYADVGLTTGTIYYYRIKTVNGNVGSSYASQTVDFSIPALPTSFVGFASGPTQISVYWTDNSTNETGFEIERSTTSGSGFSLVATAAPNLTTNTNTGLTLNSSYYFRIRSANAIGKSIYSPEVYITISAAAAATGLTATGISPTQINLSWTDNSNNESGFQIERSTSATTGFVNIGSAPINATTFANTTGLTAGVLYYYRVRSVNGVGNFGYTPVVSAATNLIAPTGLVATAFSTSQINLTWTDASANETGYQIERSLTAGSGYVLVATTAAQATSYSDTGVSEGVTYYYRIRAINAVSNSLYSTESNATTPFAIAWTNLKDVTVNGDGSISKITATTEIDAGASSLNKILPNTDGSIEFTYLGSGVYSIGLGVTDAKDMFGLSFGTNNSVSITENGQFIQALAAGISGTKYKISKLGTSINYLVNNVLVKTSPIPSDMPLVMNVRIGSGSVPNIICTFSKQLRLNPSITLPGGSNTGGAVAVNIQGAYGSATIAWTSGEIVNGISNKPRGQYGITVTDQKARTITRNYQLGYLVRWTDLQNLESSANNTLTRKVASGEWDGSAISTNILAASTDGWIEFTSPDLRGNSIIGLSTANSIAHYNSIGYGFYLYDNQVKIYESGVNVSTIGYIQDGDVYTISREGSNIKYLINNQVVRTVPAVATQPLLVDVSVVSGDVPQITSSFTRSQQIFYAIKDGIWTDPTAWSNTVGGSPASIYPSELDNVVIQGYAVSISSGVRCGNLSITVSGSANDKASVVVSGAGASLTVHGTITVKGESNTKTVKSLIVNNDAKIDILPSINP